MLDWSPRGTQFLAPPRPPNSWIPVYDLYGLKELYTRTRSLEATIAPFVDIQFPEGTMVIKNKPHRTLLSVVKGNALVNLYRKEKDSLFAYNIRSFFGKRVNRELETPPKPDHLIFTTLTMG